LPRLLGLELTRRGLALRAAAATATFIIYITIFYYIPSNLISVAKLFTADVNLPDLFTVSPLVPIIGLGIATSHSLGVFFRKTRAEGVATIAGASLLALYIYYLLNGGIISIKIPEGLIQNVSIRAVIDLTTLMQLFLIPPALSIIKGILKLLER